MIVVVIQCMPSPNGRRGLPEVDSVLTRGCHSNSDIVQVHVYTKHTD